VATVATALSYYFGRGPSPDAATTTLQDRIDRLTASLRDAAEVIEAIESEVRARQTVVERLQHDANRYEELAQLHASEVKAVAELLQGELRSSEQRTARTTLVQGFLFFVFGVAATVLLTLLVG
jgi:K+/H+ antiporter YhaU regulatory subunit KhtT